MRFHLKADAYFEADDIDNAFLLIARHYLNLSIGEGPTLELEPPSSIELRRMEEQDAAIKS
jgi:hypothetical protein